jgi:ProP effector
MRGRTPRTPESLAAVQAAVALLAEAFPQCFAVYEKRRRPLKIGVHHDILVKLDGAITADELTHALRFYTRNDGYLRACRQGVARIGLDGEPAGAVSPEHAARAATQLATRRLRQKAKPLAKPEPVKPEPMAGHPKRLGLAALKALGRARKQQ